MGEAVASSEAINKRPVPPQLVGKGFKPGISGNPTGRPKVRPVRRLLSPRAPDFAARLFELAKQDTERRLALDAITLAFAYLYGPPPAETRAEEEPAPAEPPISDEEAARLLEADKAAA